MRVIIVTGSSGGHIFPALALLEELKSRSVEVKLVAPAKESAMSMLKGVPGVIYIRPCRMGSGSLGRNIREVPSFLAGAWESLRIIIKFRPDVVVGFGSLHTLAMLFWGWLFRVKTIIHEQNVVPGRANRVLAKFADKIALSFPQTACRLCVRGEKTCVTGNPLRRGMSRMDKKESLDRLGLQHGKFTLLVAGGSQGAHRLNETVYSALAGCRESFQVVHISGAEDYAPLKDAYAQAGIKSMVFDFFHDMQYAYSAADLAICRAGATTIAELQRFSLPAVLVPYPFAYEHQLENAKVLEGRRCALVIREDDLSADKIREQVMAFLLDRQRLESMRSSYPPAASRDASAILAGEVMDLKR